MSFARIISIDSMQEINKILTLYGVCVEEWWNDIEINKELK